VPPEGEPVPPAEGGEVPPVEGGEVPPVEGGEVPPAEGEVPPAEGEESPQGSHAEQLLASLMKAIENNAAASKDERYIEKAIKAALRDKNNPLGRAIQNVKYAGHLESFLLKLHPNLRVIMEQTLNLVPQAPVNRGFIIKESTDTGNYVDYMENPFK
jgi:hypothetical protein